MVRSKNVRLSEEELKMLKEYRDDKYGETIPLGFVISELIDNAE